MNIKVHVGAGGSVQDYESINYIDNRDALNESYSSHYFLIQRVFERLTKDELFILMAKISKLLKPNGVVELIVADHDRATDYLIKDGQYQELFGPHHLTQSRHMNRWTEGDIINFMSDFGYSYKRAGASNVRYPNFRFLFTRAQSMVPSNYAMDGITLDRSWSVLDIGPGNFPLKQATAYLEHPNRQIHSNYDPKKMPEGKPVYWVDIHTTTPFPDKHWDFIFCSHVLEHLDNPERAAQEISRIGKRGVMAVPSYMKEALFLWEEREHKWDIFPPNKDGVIIFKRPEYQWRSALSEPKFKGFMEKYFRVGDMENLDVRNMRRWFRDNEPALDVIHYWEGELKVVVID